MSRVQVSWHGTYGYHSLGPWDQCAHHWQWSLYRSPPDAPAQACALLLCVANTVTMCPPLQMEMLRNNHHISPRDTWHVTRDRCPVPGVTRVPVSPLATVSPLTVVSPSQCHIMMVPPQVGTRTRGQDSGRCFTAGFTLWLYLSFGPPLPLWHTKEPTLWTKHNEDVELWTRMYRTLYKEP